LNTEKALKIVLEFKSDSLINRLNQLKTETIGKTKNELTDNIPLYNAALLVKKASSQINEIVHAVGILNSLPRILEENEIITDLSLASGASGEGIDLVTDKRVAEFKFATWQEGGSKNGMRKRQVFADYINLTILKTNKKKELYVVSSESIKKYFKGKSKWKKVLSKSGGLDIKYAEYLKQNGIKETEYIRDIYSCSEIEIFDIEEILKD
jgi:hypothetical protein